MLIFTTFSYLLTITLYENSQKNVNIKPAQPADGQKPYLTAHGYVFAKKRRLRDWEREFLTMSAALKVARKGLQCLVG